MATETAEKPRNWHLAFAAPAIKNGEGVISKWLPEGYGFVRLRGTNSVWFLHCKVLPRNERHRLKSGALIRFSARAQNLEEGTSAPKITAAEVIG